jgi:hypothetical protein
MTCRRDLSSLTLQEVVVGIEMNGLNDLRNADLAVSDGELFGDLEA